MQEQEYRNVPMNDEKKLLLHEKGKIYFTKDTERKIFFALTVAMFVWVLLSKVGLF